MHQKRTSFVRARYSSSSPALSPASPGPPCGMPGFSWPPSHMSQGIFPRPNPTSIPHLPLPRDLTLIFETQRFEMVCFIFQYLFLKTLVCLGFFNPAFSRVFNYISGSSFPPLRVLILCTSLKKGPASVGSGGQWLLTMCSTLALHSAVASITVSIRATH